MHTHTLISKIATISLFLSLFLSTLTTSVCATPFYWHSLQYMRFYQDTQTGTVHYYAEYEQDIDAEPYGVKNADATVRSAWKKQSPISIRKSNDRSSALPLAPRLDDSIKQTSIHYTNRPTLIDSALGRGMQRVDDLLSGRQPKTFQTIY